jgi:hypothetical protein
MSKIDAGQVEVDCGEETYTLKPTVKALRNINRRYGDFRTAIERVMRADFDAITYIIAEGASLSKKQAEAMQEQAFAAGLFNVSEPVAEYLSTLSNGGRPLGDEPGEGDGEGNS